jgi:hypothetical protein
MPHQGSDTRERSACSEPTGAALQPVIASAETGPLKTSFNPVPSNDDEYLIAVNALSKYAEHRTTQEFENKSQPGYERWKSRALSARNAAFP